MTGGGEGSSGYNHTQESKERMSAAKRKPGRSVCGSVSFNKGCKRWSAKVRRTGVRITIGIYATKNEAEDALVVFSETGQKLPSSGVKRGQKRSASMNCACCEQGRHCACFCRGLEKCAQRGCQVLWALLGTALLFVIYIVGLVLMVASTVTSALSWGLHNSCRIFSGVIDSYIVAVKHYIALAKASLARGDSTMAEVLQQYQDWQNIQTQFSNSGVATLATVVPVHTQSTIDAPKPIVFGRRLSGVPPGRMLFDPEHEIKNGRSIISTLNETIFQSEAQIIYYEEQVGVVEGYCVDFGALYTAFLYILVAAFCLLISELIMFAVHTKYFSSWKYEVLLMEQEEAAERKMSLVLKSRPDTPSGQGEKVLD